MTTSDPLVMSQQRPLIRRYFIATISSNYSIIEHNNIFLQTWSRQQLVVISHFEEAAGTSLFLFIIRILYN